MRSESLLPLLLALVACARAHELPPRTTGTVSGDVGTPLAIVRGTDERLHWVGYDEGLGGLAETGSSPVTSPLAWEATGAPLAATDAASAENVHVLVTPSGREALLFLVQSESRMRVGLWAPGADPVPLGTWTMEADRQARLTIHGQDIRAEYVGLAIRGVVVDGVLGGFVLDLSGGIESALLRPADVVPVAARRTGDEEMELVAMNPVAHGAYFLVQGDCSVEAGSVRCGELAEFRDHETDNGGRFALCGERLIEASGRVAHFELELLSVGATPAHVEYFEEPSEERVRSADLEGFLGVGRPDLCATVWIDGGAGEPSSLVDVFADGGRLRVERHPVTTPEVTGLVQTSHGLVLLGVGEDGATRIEGLRVE